MSRSLLAALAALFLAGCGGATAPSPAAKTARVLTGPQASTDVFDHPQVTLHAAQDGVTRSFTTGGGSLSLDVLVDAGTDTGCSFALALSASKDGPAVKTYTGMVPSGAESGETVTWSDVPAGTYLLVEDQSGMTNCRRSYTVVITAE